MKLKYLLAASVVSLSAAVVMPTPVAAQQITSAVQGTVLVVESKQTRRAQAKGALRRLIIGETHLLGVILTKFNAKAIRYGGYDYAYDYHYGGNAAPSKARKS